MEILSNIINSIFGSSQDFGISEEELEELVIQSIFIYFFIHLIL